MNQNTKKLSFKTNYIKYTYDGLTFEKGALYNNNKPLSPFTVSNLFYDIENENIQILQVEYIKRELLENEVNNIIEVMIDDNNNDLGTVIDLYCFIVNILILCDVVKGYKEEDDETTRNAIAQKNDSIINKYNQYALKYFIKEYATISSNYNIEKKIKKEALK